MSMPDLFRNVGLNFSTLAGGHTVVVSYSGCNRNTTDDCGNMQDTSGVFDDTVQKILLVKISLDI